ncbi:MAG: two-component system response regulator [Gammaproteobacteria bacterium]|nr:two-component system response regulator [Gammaproteobacteria bacterium]
MNAHPKFSSLLRVLLVEDHVILRQGLRALLEAHANVEVVGEAGTVAEALAAVELLDPSVVITDIGLPGQSGIELIAQLRKGRRALPILVLTAYHGEQSLHAAMLAGASGFVLKDASHAELLAGLHAVLAGNVFFCEALSKGALLSVVNAKSRRGDLSPLNLVTRREREVLRRIALGQSNKNAALELGVALKTVEKHRSNLMRKLDLHNSAAVTMFALRHGLVRSEDARPG